MVDGYYHFLPAQWTYCCDKLGDCDDVLFFAINLSILDFSSESRKRWKELFRYDVS